MTARVDRPTFEHLPGALGIGVDRPRISWTTHAGPDWRQQSYQLELTRGADVVVTESARSASSVLVPWPGNPLVSRERVRVRVRVTGTNGASSDWSDVGAVEAGLLLAEDWTAQLARTPWDENPDALRRPSRMRRQFVAPDDVVCARLYVTAHGLYEISLNGHRVGDDALSPGWTVYGERLRYYTYDVTDQIQPGPNALGAWLGDGWYRGRIGFHGGYPNLYGDDLSLIAQLEITRADGTRHTVATDAEWHAQPSPILSTGLYEGEAFDARLDDPRWATVDADTAGWSPVTVADQDPGVLVAPEGPPVRCTQELQPIEILTSPSGATILDFGQNISGRLRLRVSGEAGKTVTLRHAEILQHGELYTRPLRGATSTDRYIHAGGAADWEPRFTIHGFRYAQVTGWDGPIQPGTIVARVYHTDMTRTGWFETSDALVNKLHENIVWSMRDNFVDIPTDCPQRDERLGWTGDIQVFAPAASFLYDCSGMLASWLRDVVAEQLPDGTIPWYVPVIPGGELWTPIRPGAVWGDVAVLTPWTIYERFGDEKVLADQYPSAKAWVDLVEGLAGPSRLWNTGFQLGDWLDPSAPPHDPADARTDRYLVATAYFAWSASHLAQTAAVLGHDDDARHYADLAAQVKAAFHREYVTRAGLLTSDAQTAYALAIEFHLYTDDAEAQRWGTRLAELVRDAGNRIATGFAGTPVVTDALTRAGHTDVAYDLLLEQGCPSWLYTVLSGGTTMWERWDSLLPDGTVNPGGMTSFNHYALGAVADWLHRTVAGIAPLEPGYRSILFRPRPGGELTWAKARHLSPYGPVATHWWIAGDQLTIEVEVPTGATAVLDLDGHPVVHLGPGVHERKVALVVTP